MALIEYRPKRFNHQSQIVIDRCNVVIEKYMDMGITMTLRQLYYQMIAQDLFPSSWIDAAYNAKNGLPPDTKNTVKNYQRLSKLISEARLAGLVDWDAIEDRGRRPQRAAEWSTLQDGVDSLHAQFRLPRWKDQEHYVELWVEKDALASVLWPIAHRHHITLMINKGYSSQSAMWTSSNRFIEASRDGKYTTLLYLGDFDPSGEDMVRDITERMVMFGVQELDVIKVALTKEQIRRYNPPPNPAKVTDPRAKKYIAEHGKQSWEVDALPPEVLNQLMEREMAGYVNGPKMEAVKKKEEELKAALKKVTAKIQ